MRNIFLIGGKNTSPLGLHFDTIPEGRLDFAPNFGFDEFNKNFNFKHNPVNMYITKDELVNVNDWIIFNGYPARSNSINMYFPKIVLTTDTNLIEDGIQKIDNSFLDWYTHNRDCESVKIEKENEYKIIRPKGKIDFKKLKDKLDEVLDDEAIESLSNLLNIKKDATGGFAPGNYWHKECISCKKEFFGDKRATQCEPCAIEMVNIKVKVNDNGGIKIDNSEPNMYTEDEVRKLLETQRGNSYVAIYNATQDKKLASIASSAPEPGGGSWVK